MHKVLNRNLFLVKEHVGTFRQKLLSLGCPAIAVPGIDLNFTTFAQ